MTIIIVSYYKLNLSSASPLTTSSPGLLYTLKPTKFGFHVTAEGFPEKMSVLVARIAEAVYSCALGPATLAAVLEVHRRGLQSCAAEPLRSQSRHSRPLLSGDPTCIPASLARYLLNTLLSARTWTRDQRLAALDNIAAEDVVQFANSFLDNHSLECLYYGSIAKEQVAVFA